VDAAADPLLIEVAEPEHQSRRHIGLAGTRGVDPVARQPIDAHRLTQSGVHDVVFAYGRGKLEHRVASGVEPSQVQARKVLAHG
jgi:hypothetical protein